jgi:CYTH domain-containing protein
VEVPKYAKLEDEQRFVVPSIPDGATSPRTIDDRYLRGTRLRLRRVRDDAGTTYKLGHKVRPDPSRPSIVWHTTSYLDEGEYALLGTLPAATLEKRRWSLARGCADEFLGALEGLVLVEGERPLEVPPGGVEVTDDERYTGGALAGIDATAAASLLAHAQSLLA